MSSCVAAYISSVDMHTGIFTDVLMALTFMLIPAISSSFFSVCLFGDSQIAVCTSGLGLNMICTLYLCIIRIIHCKCRDTMNTSLPSIATNGLWSVMLHMLWLPTCLC